MQAKKNTANSAKLTRAEIRAANNFCDMHPDIPKGIPRFVLVGKQSSGKTRLLSAFAGRSIGGAEAASTGTRCPVWYKFESICDDDDDEEECANAEPDTASIDGEGCDIMHVGPRLRAHMEELSQNKIAGGFADRPVKVVIRTRQCLNATIVDLPGLMPVTNQGDTHINQRIGDMISLALENSDAVPLVVLPLDDTKDPKAFKATLLSLRAAIEGRSGRKEILKRTIVASPRLEGPARAHDWQVHFAEFTQAVRESFSPTTEIRFLALKPEVLLPQYTAPSNADEPAEIDAYFQHLADFEDGVIRDFFHRHGMNSLLLPPSVVHAAAAAPPDGEATPRAQRVLENSSFGIKSLRALLENEVGSGLSRNSTSIKITLTSEAEDLMRHAESLFSQDYNSLLQRVRTQCRILSEGVVALFRQDFKGAMETLSNAASDTKSPFHLCVAEVSQEELRDIVDKCSRVLEEEIRLFPDDLTMVGAINEHTQKVKPTLITMGFQREASRIPASHSLARDMTSEYTTHRAVRRAVNLFTLTALRNPQRIFTPSDMQKIATGAFDTDDTLRRMVSQLKGSDAHFNALMHYCAYLMYAPVKRWAEFLCTKIGILNGWPGITERIIAGVADIVKQECIKVAKSLHERSKTMLDFRFNEVQPTLPLTIELLLEACTVPTDMIEGATEGLGARILGAINELGDTHETCVRQFCLMDGMRTCPQNEQIASSLNGCAGLNAVAMTVGRVQLGLVLMDSATSIRTDFDLSTGCKLANVIIQRLADLPQQLIRENQLPELRNRSDYIRTLRATLDEIHAKLAVILDLQRIVDNPQLINKLRKCCEGIAEKMEANEVPCHVHHDGMHEVDEGPAVIGTDAFRDLMPQGFQKEMEAYQRTFRENQALIKNLRLQIEAAKR